MGVVELMENAAKIVNAMRKLQKQAKLVVEQAEETSNIEDIEQNSTSAAEETSKNEKTQKFKETQYIAKKTTKSQSSRYFLKHSTTSGSDPPLIDAYERVNKP